MQNKNIKELKAEKRALCRKINNAASSDKREIEGAEIARLLFQSKLWKNAKTVFAFVSLPYEPSTKEIINRGICEKEVYVPKISDSGEMKAVRLNSVDELSKGKFNIPEPKGDIGVLKDDIDLILVPCLCMGRDGVRLGKGGGFYDKFLEDYKGKTAVLCPSELVFENGFIPYENFDIRIPYIITENEIIETKIK